MVNSTARPKKKRHMSYTQDLGLFCYQEGSWSETGYKLKNNYTVNMEEEMTPSVKLSRVPK